MQITEEHYKNNLGVRVFGIRRSGNHAIIVWFSALFEKPVYFINDVADFDEPAFYQALWDTAIYQTGLFKTHSRSSYEGFFKGVKKDTLIHSYEDFDITRLDRRRFQRNSRKVGLSIEEKNIIVLRDPFNLFASRYKLVKRGLPVHAVPPIIQLWKSYAREALMMTEYIPNKVVVLYNRWFTDKGYRQELCNIFGLSFSDRGFNTVPNTGGIGSSFDGTKYDGRSQEMRVFNRWEQFSDDIEFRNYFRDREIWDLSYEIFGEIEGVGGLR